MQVSFIIPLFNCLSLTQACVASLQRSLPFGLEHEIILVDDGSTDGTREWIATLEAPFRVLLNDTNLGYAAANNRAAAIARGEYLCLINNDLVFPQSWFSSLLRLQESLGDRAGAIGNVQRRVSNREIDHSGIRIDHKGRPVHEQGWWPWPLAAHYPPAITGACLLIKRSLFTDLKGFDEGFRNGGEDVDLCFRLAAVGRINAVAIRSMIYHHVSASPGRKAADEHNAQRLVEKWRELLVRHGTRDWCWHYLTETWTTPRAPHAWTQAAALLAYALHLRPTPPEFARTGMHSTLDAEQERRAKLFS